MRTVRPYVISTTTRVRADQVVLTKSLCFSRSRGKSLNLLPGWTEITLGQPMPHGKSLPVDYEIQGELTGPILPGQPLAALRFRRNGVDSLGVFRTSQVREIQVEWLGARSSWSILQSGMPLSVWCAALV